MSNAEAGYCDELFALVGTWRTEAARYDLMGQRDRLTDDACPDGDWSVDRGRADILRACADELAAALKQIGGYGQWCHQVGYTEGQRDAKETVVLQAVLDAIAGTLDPSTQIADHPNVKFAQMQRLKLLQEQIDVER